MTTVIVITDQCVLIISMGMSTTVLKLKSSIGKSVVGYNETSIASHHLYMPFITVLHVPVSVAIATLHLRGTMFKYRDSDTQKVLP